MNSPRGEQLSSLELIEYENTAPRTITKKEESIRQELGISPVRYYQLLNRALEQPEVMEHYPVLASRLRRKRDRRAQRRSQARHRDG
ncbi:DUF3263 domain-containing protein [Corynebacterium sp. sy039]|uniref:DUF3263 domain-containing protein n=1 Tax=Corynebacterium sp. sy039 TaxID=2599641 RepID=UPI0011B45A90|nr:DUF3263 domain-containing protein [Corynebacterium sp. sy039]QDZ41885.1 DUF3263 domain-containing protein [Corynebacterium sp. sy039]